MCGICGWIDWEIDLTQHKPIVEAMTRSLAARGPDASGYWWSKHAGIGHRRLIVVDPEGGAQPMVRSFGNETFILTYNGELYNTAEIRSDLQTLGYVFQSYSDTEVVLLSFVHWGPDCVNRFNGIYAFGIWREQDQSLFLARDRMGVKPLFYAQRGSAFYFGSELKALLAHPNLKPELDAEGLAEIFGLGPARTPGHGVFKDIFELRPGFWALYNRDRLQLKRYWTLESKPHLDNLETTTNRVRELVTDSIKRQLVSDVPVCTFLSGGLDSSIISAIASTHAATQSTSLDTYSIDFTDNDQYFRPNDFQPNHDAPWIQLAARNLKTNHHSVFIDNPQLAAALRPAVIARDLPGMADIDASLYLFCREIKKGATVGLSGECADEVFGGYPWFHRQDALQANTFPWSLSLDLRRRVLAPEVKNIIRIEEYVQDRYHQTLAEVPRLSGEEPAEAKRRELFYLNLNWFMAVLLDRKDRMSMASGLEVRVPFCDHRLVEYVWNIPWAMKYWDQREKGILRRAVRGLLPEEIIYRRKSPYPKTHHPGYRKMMQTEMLNIMNDPATPLRDLVDFSQLREFTTTDTELLNQPWFGQLMTGPQMLAYLIQIEIWLKEYQIRIKL
ncbi:MAG TPA: asparagine synthase (glutamine-hydrolyzing) [Bacillota bacterium]|nr:asparagine synthase (glutamine-hydrolyzing) [Bacillota bacterium]